MGRLKEILNFHMYKFFSFQRLFLSICDTNKVDQALQSIQNCFDPPVCAIRLAELTRMKSPKEIGVRIDLIQSMFVLLSYLTNNNYLLYRNKEEYNSLHIRWK